MCPLQGAFGTVGGDVKASSAEIVADDGLG